MADSTIRIGMLRGGWVIDGQFQVLNPNYLPVDVTSSTATTFTASYGGIDYIFPISDLAAFLDRSQLFIPYPSFTIMETDDGPMTVGDTRIANVRMFYSNGQNKLLSYEDIYVNSSNPDIIKVEGINGAITLTALSKGEAVIKIGFDDYNFTSKGIIVLNQGETLFSQSNFVGLFPNGIN